MASSVRAGSDAAAKIGPITMPAQLEIIKRHIADALARGGRALVGGEGAVGDRYVQPTVLVDVPEDSAAVREETFGPTLTIAKVRDMDEAVAKANDSTLRPGVDGLLEVRGVELARRLRSGMTAVNGVISFAGIPSLPFGGIGDSGFGRIHGPEGLREFARAKAIARQRFKRAAGADDVQPHGQDRREGRQADHAAARQAPLTRPLRPRRFRHQRGGWYRRVHAPATVVVHSHASCPQMPVAHDGDRGLRVRRARSR